MNKKIMTCLCALLVASIGRAQVDAETNNLFQRAKSLVDKSVVHGVDTNYIKTPEHPWQVSLKSRVAQTDLQMHSVVDGAELFDGEGLMPFIRGLGDMATDPRFMTRVSTSLGVKVGYKGLSASYSFPIGGDKSQNISLKSTGSWYAVNLRWHKFKTKTARTHYAGAVQPRDVDYNEATEDYNFFDSGDPYAWDETEKEELASPISIKTLIFDGFYIFNRKTFSYAAAYNQKTIQVRSAGSPIVGLMGYYADFDYDNRLNADLIYEMDGIGRLRQYQLALGAGYAYNFVPAKGWLISAMAMPMVTVVNRTRINTYDSNFKELAHAHLLEQVINEALKEETGEEMPLTDYSNEYQLQSTGVHSRNNRIALNFTTRLSVTYNWDRYFINANGQFNNFNYKHKAMHGHLNDWYINASVGMRF
ncbi:MAG: DUF4421 family protein [Bacteroidaceae bacterium]|nr:DUF4421 family protein [Bacteroidaceae bacterium]